MGDSVKTGNFNNLCDFVEKTSQKENIDDTFQSIGSRFLKIDIENRIWIKSGSVTAFDGGITFGREGTLGSGIGKFAKNLISGENRTFSQAFTYAEGKGYVYCADHGKNGYVIGLENESVYIQGDSLLAFEDTLNYDVKVIKRSAGVLSGGLFNIKLEGTGLLTVSVHYEPLTIKTVSGKPFFTDPNLTVGWSGNIYPQFKIDEGFKMLFRGGNVETIQYQFNGDGFVIIKSCQDPFINQEPQE